MDGMCILSKVTILKERFFYVNVLQESWKFHLILKIFRLN